MTELSPDIAKFMEGAEHGHSRKSFWRCPFCLISTDFIPDLEIDAESLREVIGASGVLTFCVCCARFWVQEVPGDPKSSMIPFPISRTIELPPEAQLKVWGCVSSKLLRFEGTTEKRLRITRGDHVALTHELQDNMIKAMVLNIMEELCGTDMKKEYGDSWEADSVLPITRQDIEKHIPITIEIVLPY